MGLLTKAILEAVEKAGKSAKEELIPASEALAPHEGKTLKAIQYDRMRVNPETGEFGGPEYSNLPEISDPHRKARAVAAVSSKGAGTKYINQFINEKPGSIIHTPMLGSVEQHRGNPTMFSRFHQELMQKVNNGEVSQEQINAINDKLNSIKVKKGKEMKPLFAEPIDVTSIEFILKPKTFDQRTKFADVLNGEGVGGKKGQVIDVASRLADVIDPYTAEAPTGSFGHRLIQLEPNILHEPSLHGDYPYQITGEDLGVRMTPIPSNLMKDFHEFIRNKTISEKFPEGREPTPIDFRTGDINQKITADWLQYLKDHGYKQGGDVHMAGGGKLVKALIEGAEKLGKKTAHELAHEKAQKNAVEMLGLHPKNTAIDRARAMGFDVDNPMYHGTTKDFPSFENTRDIGFHFGTPDQADNINIMDRGWTIEKVKDNANVIPVYLKTKNTLPTKDWGNDWNFSVAQQLKNEGIISKEEYEKFRLEGNKNPNIKNWNKLVTDLLKSKGYDSLLYKNIHESSNKLLQDPNANLNSTIILDPSHIRSKHAAFDPAESESTELLKAKGGAVADDSHDIESDPTAYLMNEIKPVETKITSAEQFRKAIGKPTPYVNEAIQSLIEDTKRIKPRGIIDVPVNATLEFAGLPSEFMNPEDVISPYRQDVVMPKSKAKGYKLPQVFPSGEELKQSVKNIGLTEDDYPALQTMASFLGAPEAKVIGTGAAKAATQGIKGVGKLAGETLKHGARLIEEGRVPGLVEPRMNIIKDPGGMVVGGERELDRQLTDMYKNESIDNYDGTYGHDHNAAALNNWVNTKVRKYIRNQAGTKDDPILKAIESGVEHNFAPAIGDTKYYVKHKRALVGKPEEGIAKTDLGKEWEYKVDSTFTPKKSADIKEILNNPMGFVDPAVADRRRASLLRVEHDLPIHNEQDLEALKLINQIPDENVYTIDVSSLTNRLGLNHVSDVLYEDLQTGRLRPEQLNQMSIEKAIRRTAEYDAQKAREMEKAHATSVEGMPVPKQYDDGFKWVELKHPEDKTKTAAALKSEGQMMGHCVGSYCPQVESGHTKIYSLRGPDNKSHVTIEVTKRNHLNDWLDANKEEIQKDPLLKQMAYYDPDEKYPGMYSQEEVEQAYIADITKMLRAKGAPVHEAKHTWMDIEQIKGKQNKRPDEKYQKYVSDFIQSNPTGHEIADIHELQNTNLHDVQSMIAEGILPKRVHMHPDVDKALGIDQPHLAKRMNDPRFSNEITDEKFNMFKDIGRDFASKGKYYVTDEDILNAVKAKHLKKAKGGPINLQQEYKLENLRRRYG
jgi:hypothetical protein